MFTVDDGAGIRALYGRRTPGLYTTRSALNDGSAATVSVPRPAYIGHPGLSRRTLSLRTTRRELLRHTGRPPKERWRRIRFRIDLRDHDA